MSAAMGGAVAFRTPLGSAGRVGVRVGGVGVVRAAAAVPVASVLTSGASSRRGAMTPPNTSGKRAVVKRATGSRGGGGVVVRASIEHAQTLFDLAGGVGLPCSVQNCGDMIYRSTLDPQLRGEVAPLFTPVGLTILTVLGFYLTITPGVLGGFVDYYILRNLLGQKRYSIDDFELGPKLGEGGFGVVYKATGVADGEQYVLKRCKDYGDAEVWTNSRLMRSCPNNIASYRGAFYGPKELPKKKLTPSQGSIWVKAANAAKEAVNKAKKVSEEAMSGEWEVESDEDPLWLVWKFEGSQTLAALMEDKDFPYNVEPFVFKSNGGVAIEGEPRGTKRKYKILSTLFGQILENLAAAHATGIILRDVKPENMIFDQKLGRLRLIDLGAAADLRFGFNYQPKEFILDPRFSGPEEYIMSTQTPEAPPTPVALVLSPVLWQLNVPDRFDSYSAGVTLLQMCIPSLRPDNNLIAFRRTLEENGESLTTWRQALSSRYTDENAEGFEVLDLNDRAGWELVKSLMTKKRENRSSATAAVYSRFVQGQNPVIKLLDRFVVTPAEGDAEGGGLWAWLVFRVARSGTNREGGFTEAQLSRFNEEGKVDKPEDASKYLGYVASETLAKYGVDRVGRSMDQKAKDAKAKEINNGLRKAEGIGKAAGKSAGKSAGKDGVKAVGKDGAKGGKA
eukprot:CAMPEP_0197593732 /NCGR_PEP_ID=MMETSP1326-20131121/18897_1 /TAXON_ID=1155430 /ORGANISM="Genus nov. species nov., Strain RCC2288" /LENGTH=676 /DNA_ID=CAMNT_0043159765 /DNA_START=89 /DNA_END=2116 /DNA_ORIENTATION=-